MKKIWVKKRFQVRAPGCRVGGGRKEGAVPGRGSASGWLCGW